MRRPFILLALFFLTATAWSAIPVIQTRSEQKETSDVATTTITAPASIADGDVLVICISTDGNSVFTFPTGFTTIDQGLCPGAGGGQCALGCAYKIASSESGNYIVTWTGGDEQAVSEMYRVDGAVSGSEIQDPNESNTGESPDIDATITPVASTDTNDSLVFCVSGHDDDDVTTDGGGDADYTTEDVDESNSGAGTCSIGVQSKGIATAAVPPQCDLTLTNFEEWRITWFAIRSIAPTASAIPRRRIIKQ